MNFDSFFSEELIFFINASSQEDIFKQMFQRMHELGYVKESYLEALSEREKVYPTGIQTERIGIAIPHTDSVHVNKESIGVAVLEKPVSFTHMGTENQTVEASIIFMLAIQKPEQQLGVLQVITGLIQNNDLLQSLLLANDKEKIISIIQEYSKKLNV
ncbi:PTS sugar transporter subunit IIA [Oceanobacillus sp. CFH 90083]|uniref:PTS sugar transporter subunit IIA n=1 Tax=Oceanobacillus sp. CFH 90083 TaxID=2592336 RepID=UPI0018846F4B|nr:PTS sugar transporter subunit IIA [Oceanobacillus sp. CFH 90083]